MTFNSQRGSILSSVLIATSLLGVIMAAAWTVVGNVPKSALNNKIQNSRDLVMISALRASRTAPFYYQTALRASSGNEVGNEFVRCMIDDGLGIDCVAAAAGVPIPRSIILYDDAGSSGVAQIGTETSPARYDNYGRICAVADDNCPFNVWGTYTVTCEGGTDTCAQADYLFYTVHVELHPDFVAKYPNLIGLKALTSSQKISISDWRRDYFPVFPPVVVVCPTPGHPACPPHCYTTPQWCWGAPVVTAAGWAGWYANMEKQKILIDGGEPYEGVGSGGGGSGGSGSGGTAPATTSCDPGQAAVGSSCLSFSF